MGLLCYVHLLLVCDFPEEKQGHDEVFVNYPVVGAEEIFFRFGTILKLILITIWVHKHAQIETVRSVYFGDKFSFVDESLDLNPRFREHFFEMVFFQFRIFGACRLGFLCFTFLNLTFHFRFKKLNFEYNQSHSCQETVFFIWVCLCRKLNLHIDKGSDGV